jgi:hypothetical protein
MSTTIQNGASAPSDSSDYSEVTVKRDGDRPLVFDGKTLAKVSMQSGLAIDAATMTAAVYITRGGKYISTLSKVKTGVFAQLRDLDAAETLVNEVYKAQVASSFEEAVAWFRPGRLTDALRTKLGLNEPERID